MQRIVPIAALVALSACAAPPGDAPVEDACGAAAYQGLIGQPLPDDFDPDGPVRVFGPDDALTMDFVVQRLNVELDAERERVVRVFCG